MPSNWFSTDTVFLVEVSCLLMCNNIFMKLFCTTMLRVYLVMTVEGDGVGAFA